MKHRRHLITALLSLAGAILLQAGPAQALTISPPMFDYALSPGDTVKDVIKVTNESRDPITVYPEVYNFTSSPNDETRGVPQFYPANEERNGHELAKWIGVSTQPITLQAGQRGNLEFSITVPKDGSPGSYFGSIQLLTTPPSGGSGPQIGLVGGTGILILTRVSGQAVEDLQLSRFSSDQATYTHLPVDFHIRLENDGTVHLRPTGNVFIRNMFGRQVASIPVNDEFRSILPSSARRFDVTWFRRKVDDGASELRKQWSNFAIGKYKATLVLDYGDGNKILTGEYDFWVFPWMVLVVLLGGAAALLVALRLGLKTYNRSVIKKYESMKAKKG